MKKTYFLLIALCFFATTKAQIVNIPDATFKARLLGAATTNTKAKNLAGNYFKIDANSDGEIQQSEALTVSYLDISTPIVAVPIPEISSLSGIEYFKNLTTLNCDNNEITILDVSGVINLKKLGCSLNQLTNLNIDNLTLDYLDCSKNYLSMLNISGLASLQYLNCSQNRFLSLDTSSLTKLTFFDCSDNQLTKIDVSKLINLLQLICSYNKLTSIDVSLLPKLIDLYCDDNRLVSVLAKNGKLMNMHLGNNTTLEYICADEANILFYKDNYDRTYGRSPNCQINSYCSFTPGGTFYTIQGKTTIDIDANGCDANDTMMSYLKYVITGNNGNAGVIADSTGKYSIALQKGTYTITPLLENLAYYTISPISIAINFPTDLSPILQNFCITPNGVRPDLEISLLPLHAAVPGFDAKYKITYKNKGNTTQSGSVGLVFDDTVLDLVDANPATTTQTLNNLSWDFTNLLPFENREITFTLNLNSPMETPALIGGAILAYNATITSAATDETPIDNTFAFNQIVVNSFDPNDKTCLEGSTISPSLIGKYVHYMIRFENSGTANAKNIVVKDMIDLSKFDISTLVPTSASHSFVTNISAGNKVEFIFENINLPFDDSNNDGYIAFKIKTLPTLKVGDTFTNDASIYFDYNFPIVTKLASSTFKTLGTQDFEFSSYFTLYPNPAQSVLNISSKESIEVKSISVYNTLGQLVLVIPNAEKVSKIDVSSLTSGNYFIKVNSDKGSSNARFVKE